MENKLPYQYTKLGFCKNLKDCFTSVLLSTKWDMKVSDMEKQAAVGSKRDHS